MAKKHELAHVDKVKPAYLMPAPNDDAAAYGWDLSKLRYPDPKSPDKKDPDPGRHMFNAPQENGNTMHRYGHNAVFLCPKYLQIILDQSKALHAAAKNAAENRYRASDIDEIQAVVDKVFKETVLPDIVANFEKVSRAIAQFYAARMAHVKKFGREDA